MALQSFSYKSNALISMQDSVLIVMPQTHKTILPMKNSAEDKDGGLPEMVLSATENWLKIDWNLNKVLIYTEKPNNLFQRIPESMAQSVFSVVCAFLWWKS